MLALLLALQAAVSPGAQDSLPQVTLREALQRAAQLDPNYVSALGQVDNAVWARRSAFAVFILPSISLATTATRNNPPFFNFGTLRPEKYAVQGSITASYDLFLGGQKFAELSRSGAALESAHASELIQRFTTAFLTESDYYDVLANAELDRVARDRLRRARDQLAVARAKVSSGAAVQTDSLNLRLELTRAQIAQLQQASKLRIARLQLGRRIGAAGPVNAAPLDSALAPELAMSLADAITQAAAQGPEYRRVAADERAAAAVYRSRLGNYLPHATLSWTGVGFDNKFVPSGAKFTQLSLAVSFPLWDNMRRELSLSQARVSRDVTRAIRDDMQRAVQHDVTAAYDAYETTRTSVGLSAEALAAARESFRIQQTRYQSGATTILDLVDAEVNLSQAEADYVAARYGTRLALAGLETILGKRLFTDKEPQ
ncbi:MAG TPA: TolC family protein [Gemmatimonadales bacterium]|nr:TolC family protein [Gemmatimonadales bacterium]